MVLRIPDLSKENEEERSKGIQLMGVRVCEHNDFDNGDVDIKSILFVLVEHFITSRVMIF